MPCLASTATSCAGTPRLAKVGLLTVMSSVDRADKRWSPWIGGGRVSKAPHPWKPFRSPSDERPARPRGVAYTARYAQVPAYRTCSGRCLTDASARQTAEFLWAVMPLLGLDTRHV